MPSWATVIIDSGGGYQAFWRLREPVVLTPNNVVELEGYNKRLAAALGGDDCHNLDRIMRLPGTINLPDAKKRERGRVPALARVVRWGDA